MVNVGSFVHLGGGRSSGREAGLKWTAGWHGVKAMLSLFNGAIATNREIIKGEHTRHYGHHAGRTVTYVFGGFNLWLVIFLISSHVYPYMDTPPMVLNSSECCTPK